MSILRIGLGLAIALAAQLACAQALEVISLRHRSADQVLDTLRPLVEPGGVLSGQGNQLIVRASAANIAQIRRALHAIDLPQRRLQISVRFDDTLEASRREIGASGAIDNRGARVEVRGNDSQARGFERVDQRVMALDGGRATIMTGRVEEMTSGFEVVPRVAGNSVTLQIYSSHAGSTTASSTASGPLGEWFELGSIAVDAGRDQRSIGSAGRASGMETRRILVKVEALGN
ncbi:MAG TPA: secretin N-terminal domain-containing protein [Burkholderiales bacterium]|nr:secretin N-terminal domain-containing protein [Burkholderiales bacterium]